jgi:hypothetical protein
MTAEQLVQFIHREKEHDTTYPSSGEDNYTLYLALVGDATRLWETEKNVKWDELWVTLADAATGDKTVEAATLDYDMPTDFRQLGAWVRTTTSAGQHTYWQVMKPEQAEAFKNDSEYLCWITGNTNTGFDLHFNKQPTAGDTINYPYYKTVAVPATGAAVIEMSDPLFCAYYALSVVDEENQSKWLGMAEQRMKGMKYANAESPYLQPNGPGDVDWDAGVAGFGE